ncbi:MAG: 23S rRNA pseudouridine2605 synthase, partial [Planctomycetota bacterium]
MSPKKKASKKRSTKKTTGRRENTGIVRRTASPEAVDEAPKAAGNKKKSKKSKSRPLRASGRRLPARSSSAREAKRDYDLIRLNKFLADHGVASRRACDELIAGGKVTIDGVPVTELGTKVDPAIQSIEVNGELLKSRGDRRYYILNKPPGVVCTNERRETRPRAIDMITDRDKGRIYSVGRLDEDSRGLLLLT